MSKKSNNYLLIMGISSFSIPILCSLLFPRINYGEQNYIDTIIYAGFNNLLRGLFLFLLFEPFSLLWKKYKKKKELHPLSSKEFWEDEIEYLFVYWLISNFFYVLYLVVWAIR